MKIEEIFPEEVEKIKKAKSIKEVEDIIEIDIIISDKEPKNSAILIKQK